MITTTPTPALTAATIGEAGRRGSSRRTIRTGAITGLAAQVLFTAAWLVAQTWQPTTYRHPYR
jgi:transposase